MSVFKSSCCNGSTLCPVVSLGLLDQVPELEIGQVFLLRREHERREGTYLVWALPLTGSWAPVSLFPHL